MEEPAKTQEIEAVEDAIPENPGLRQDLNLLGRERCVARLSRFTNLLTS